MGATTSALQADITVMAVGRQRLRGPLQPTISTVAAAAGVPAEPTPTALPRARLVQLLCVAATRVMGRILTATTTASAASKRGKPCTQREAFRPPFFLGRRDVGHFCRGAAGYTDGGRKAAEGC